MTSGHARAEPAPWRLLICDVDSTLIVGEIVEMLAEFAGHRDAVAQITAAAMRGELDFAESLHRRVALLAGLDEAVLDEVGRSLVLTAGARELMAAARAAGVYRGLVSGGFSQVTRYVAEELDLDFAAANTLEVVGGRLTGGLTGEVIDRSGKERALRAFADRVGVPMEATVAVGDGANDLDMFAAAGMSIAFNAAPVVRECADRVLDGPSLAPVMDIIGLSRD